MQKPLSPPQLEDIVAGLGPSQAERTKRLTDLISNLREVAPDGRYRHWDKLRHLDPPDGISHEEWWLTIKFARMAILKPLPLVDSDGHAFNYSTPDEAQELLHFIDQQAGGVLGAPEPILNDDAAKRQYLVNSLMEEAIRSSQLEGAATSRAVAKEMIRTGRPPVNRGERMIFNNYRALEFMREGISSELQVADVLELQRILTEGTLQNPDAAGRLQTPADDRVEVIDSEGHVLHTPPPAEQLPDRMEAMCAFANGEGDTGFLHPVLRSILLHFWLGYDHPFEDGNGRTARALFYWSMAKHRYWLTEYLSISNILRKAPTKYMRAYLYTETDDRDTTYFLLYHLSVIRRAITEFQQYVERKVREIREFESVLKPEEFNYRQLALLRNAARYPQQRYTFASHARSHRVSWASSRNDLLNLQRRGFLLRRRVGKKYWFTPAPNLLERLKSPKEPARVGM